ncbi:OLC1v1019339C1 [Oldenlandia corymbosa var. corymbosa]|uniref:OLC1v1019339C1 n=1 Tax=Oldenlandia corymbosa var. corymbosa TaxID=529605 RepID=A0AAV1EDP8_OLDCO|nr:OLC1v1019339C1 [Oldenlandia corymbosa var. corymbosa]
MAFNPNELPPGCGFHPTELEIITILRNRVLSQQGYPGVLERNLYGPDATPWLILSEEDGTIPWQRVGNAVDIGKKVYVFTVAPRLGNGSQRDRSAGCGSWVPRTGPRNVMDGGGLQVGTRRSLSFQPRTEQYGRDRWVMHEYELDDSQLNPGQTTDLVLCRVAKYPDVEPQIPDLNFAEEDN